MYMCEVLCVNTDVTNLRACLLNKMFNLLHILGIDTWYVSHWFVTCIKYRSFLPIIDLRILFLIDQFQEMELAMNLYKCTLSTMIIAVLVYFSL